MAREDLKLKSRGADQPATVSEPLPRTLRLSRAAILEPGEAVATAEERAAAWRSEFERETAPFRQVFDHAAIGIAVVDLDGRFLKVNPAFCRIVGYSDVELLATDFQSITHPDDLDADVSLARQLFRNEIDHYHMEKRYFHREGHVVWVQLSASVVRDPHGHVYYAIAQVQDISSRKLAEFEAARRQRQLERLTQTVPELLNVLATTQDHMLEANVLHVVMKALGSEVGLFVRFDDEGNLVGCCVTQSQTTPVHCPPFARGDMWNAALTSEQVQISNQACEVMHRKLSRCLVAPLVYYGTLLGLFQVGDAEVDYNDDDRDLMSRVTRMIAPALNGRMKRSALTPREAEVMDRVVSGLTQKQIALEFGVSIQTIAKHHARVLEKLGVRSDVELVRLAVEMRSPLSSDVVRESVFSP